MAMPNPILGMKELESTCTVTPVGTLEVAEGGTGVGPISYVSVDD